MLSERVHTGRSSVKMENTSISDKMGLGQATGDNPVSQRFSRHLPSRLKKITYWVLAVLLFLTYNVYLGYSIHHSWLLSSSWCHDVRLLIILTIIVYGSIIYYALLKQWLFQPLINFLIGSFRRIPYSGTGWIVLYLGIGIFLIVDTSANRERLISAGGLVVLVALGYVFSAHRTKVIWRHVLWGSTLQFVFGLLILRWDVGQEIFSCLGDKVKTFLEYTDFGSAFVFGYLITGEMEDLPVQPAPFAFKILCVILFFSFCTSILYYCGIMQRLVVNIGWFLQKTIGTTSCESMNAAGNIFLGQTEAPLLIQPYLPMLTKSEIHAVMTGGFASIAGSVMAAFISFGVSPSHLLSACVMSAPAALAYSKLFYPETEESRTNAKDISVENGKEHNVLEAATKGVSSAIPLVANIAANLVAFIAVLRFLDSSLTWFGSLIGWDFITFEWLLSKIFVPLAFIMGVPWIDCQEVSRLIGIKTTVNEFVAYAELGKLIEKQALTSRSEAIATYALCGFSNISAIGIQLGALGTLAPARKNDIARVAVRAMIAGSAACFMTACIAGTLLDKPIH
ncbi:solute carrier family 28 member 3-like isoform X2 [Tachypleus tridentatus]|uniref:solute carrier family 28 member 3-like isoform X2 n=1 Tax=Tachypleus tridentatus TaxID=6853 RepID=UPI003FD0BFB9